MVLFDRDAPGCCGSVKRWPPNGYGGVRFAHPTLHVIHGVASRRVAVSEANPTVQTSNRNPMTHRIDETLQQAAQVLEASDSPRLDAEVLLAFVLDKPRSHLLAWPEHKLTQEQHRRFDALIEKRRQGTPVAYLTGGREFWSLPLAVEDHTLIPRPDTELLVELALQRIPAERPFTVADLGTGSGAVALAIASERPRCTLLATDRSLPSLVLARRNADRLGIHNVFFLCGHWCDPLRTRSLDLLVSNPPYIEENDPHLSRGDVRFEPRHALAAGADGLDAIRAIAEQAPRVLKPGAALLLEHGWRQGGNVKNILCKHLITDTYTETDLAGRARVTGGCLGA